MDDKITDADIEQLCKENALANEQLRRIRAERMVTEALAEQEKCSCQDGN